MTETTAATHFSDPIVIALIGGQIILIITALVTGTTTIITHLRVGVVKDQQESNAAQILAVAKDTEAIKGHVNSEKTASDGREIALQQENKLLREMLTEGKATAALLAQAVATRTRNSGEGTPVPVPASAPAVVDSLDRIDQNTAAIAENTAKGRP